MTWSRHYSQVAWLMVTVALLSLPVRTVWARTDDASRTTQNRDVSAPAPSAAKAPTITAEARALFEKGLLEYQRGDFHQAIRSLEASYNISGAPGLLFNLGQAYRMAGDCSLAVERYRDYLAHQPTAPNRDRVKARIVEMEECVAAQQAMLPVPAEASKPTEAPPLAPVPPPAPSLVTTDPTTIESGKATAVPIGRRQGVQLALLGGALAMGVAGGWMLAEGNTANRQTDHLFRAGGTWDQAAKDQAARGQTLTVVGVSVLGAAAVAAGAGVWSVVAAGPSDPEETRLERRRVRGLLLSGAALGMGTAASFLLVRSHTTDAWLGDTFARGGTWDQQTAQWEKSNRRDRWLGAGLAGGAAVAAAGAAWFLVDQDRESPPPVVAVSVSDKGVGIQCQTQF